MQPKDGGGVVTFHPVVSKLWGFETHIINTPRYCGKILTVQPGFQCSLHYHLDKDETFYLLEGTLRVEYYPGMDLSNLCEVVLLPGASLRLPPGTPHRFWSEGGRAVFVEFSTHDSPEDSIRLEESRRR